MQGRAGLEGNLPCNYSDCGRKLKYPEKTHTKVWRRCKLYIERPQVQTRDLTQDLFSVMQQFYPLSCQMYWLNVWSPTPVSQLVYKQWHLEGMLGNCFLFFVFSNYCKPQTHIFVSAVTWGEAKGCRNDLVNNNGFSLIRGYFFLFINLFIQLPTRGLLVSLGAGRSIWDVSVDHDLSCQLCGIKLFLFQPGRNTDMLRDGE